MDMLADAHVVVTFAKALGKFIGQDHGVVNERRDSQDFRCQMSPKYLYAENY
jgi:hypothetical protein